METFQNAVVHGRFQPPHNGHIRYILSALDRSEHLYIGICTPKICTEEESRQNGYPCTQALNPFSHAERADMIRLSLEAAGISSNRYTVIPFPSDYTHLSSCIPNDTVFLMSVTAGSDNGKISHIESLGYKTQTIMTKSEGDARERSGTIRDNAHAGNPIWEASVPAVVAEYIKEHGLVSKITPSETARDMIE